MTNREFCAIAQLQDKLAGKLDYIYRHSRSTSVRVATDKCIQYLSTLFGICEANRDSKLSYYQDIIDLLPDRLNLSAGDIMRLEEHIEAWKRGE